MLKNKLNFKLLNLLLLMIIIYIFIATSGYWGGILLKIFNICLPFLIAFAFAYVLYPFVEKLEKKGIRKNLAITLVMLVISIVVIGLIWVTLPMIYDQLVLFSKSIIQVITDFSSRFDLNLGEFQQTITDALNQLIKDLGSYISTGTIDFLGKSVNIVTNTVIVVIVGIYFLAYMEKIRSSIKKFLKSMKNRSFAYVKKLDKEIGNYCHGLAIFMAIQFIEYTFLFWIVGHPNWLLLGTLACVTTVIPYFGGMITNIIAVITASVISTPLFIATLIICMIFPQLDGYLISPKIYGKTNNVNPVMVIFAVGAGGSLLGFLGIVISLPVYIVLQTTWKFFREDIKDKIDEVKGAREGE